MKTPTISKSKNYLLCLVFSLIPGLSHLYLGLKTKALVLFLIDCGLALTFVLSGTILMKLLMVNIYILTFVPACLETYQLARYGTSKVSTDSKWYTVVLLLTTGFSALPLLWQNKKVSRKFKVAWTIAVPALALCFFLFLISYYDKIELMLQNMLNA